MEKDKEPIFNREEFLHTVINLFINKDVKGIERAYYGCIKLIDSGIKNDLHQRKKHNYRADQEKRRLLEMCLDLFKNKEVRNLIAKGELNTSQVFNMFKERMLGDNKRQYDISELYDEKIIANKSDGQGKCIKFTEKNGIETSFYNLKNEAIKIKCIGQLSYKNQFGEKSYITKYQIARPTAGNETETFEVYSNINIPQMSDSDEYREIVLSELLSENNIKLSNANGYLGVITEDHSMDVGEEEKSRIRYKYKASPNYMLLGETDEMSAVKDYEQREKETKIVPEEKSKDEGEER